MKKINKKYFLIGLFLGLLPIFCLGFIEYNYDSSPSYCSQAFDCKDRDEKGIATCKYCVDSYCTETKTTKCKIDYDPNKISPNLTNN